ncbi:hypothetical protein AVEN_30296-1 [Araneus ventricosus]|uniref:Uncharacterized protein n=1 Tax=Araneus ventricosus TaxID=182803 RepID=A0A4Y2T059_ARAVE|nr:hypothetical protein AVEN_30296-1 [Araneus ventricosus]
MSGNAYSRAVRAPISVQTATATVIFHMIYLPLELRAGVVEILGNADRAEVLANEEETATELMDIFVAKLDTLNNQNPTGELWILYFEMVTLAKHFIE